MGKTQNSVTSMNRTQQLTCGWLQQSSLTGEALLLEALLRRGFLAYRDDQGVWLGTGSHSEDLDVLRLIDGLAIEPVTGHKERMARIKLPSPVVSVIDVAIRIVGLPENRSFIGTADMPHSRRGTTWGAYRNMVWGNMVAVCPIRLIKERALGYIALDLGVALLVKTLPLARVTTNGYSCDGHGRGRAKILFGFPWDAIWGKVVFVALGTDTPNSTWDWHPALHVAPLGGYGDEEVLGMLNDIQVFSRRLLQQGNIDRIGHARTKTLMALGEATPTAEAFTHEAQRQLTVALMD